MRASVLLSVVVACANPPVPTPVVLGETHVAAQPVPSRYSGRLRYHMRDHREDLAQLDRLLTAGQLADAKVLAVMLSRPAPDLVWSIDAARASNAASALANAQTLDDACEKSQTLLTACVACHTRLGVQPALEFRFACRR